MHVRRSKLNAIFDVFSQSLHEMATQEMVEIMEKGMVEMVMGEKKIMKTKMGMVRRREHSCPYHCCSEHSASEWFQMDDYCSLAFSFCPYLCYTGGGGGFISFGFFMCLITGNYQLPFITVLMKTRCYLYSYSKALKMRLLE